MIENKDHQIALMECSKKKDYGRKIYLRLIKNEFEFEPTEDE